jgi:hypothetical protein
MTSKFLENKKLLFIVVISLILFAYLVIFFMRFNNVSGEITEKELKIENVDLNIMKEKKNKEKTKNIDETYIRNLFFEHDTDFVNYVRSVFQKYDSKLTIYQSTDSEKNLIVNVTISVKVTDFFLMIKEIEEGKRFVSIRNMSIRKDIIYPNLKVTMKLEGFYR